LRTLFVADLQDALDWAELASKILTALGLLAGGIWALFTFVLFRSAVGNLQLTIHPQVIKYRGDLRIVLINVTLKNVGKVKIKAGSGGCRLWVWRLPDSRNHGECLELNSGEALLDNVDLLAQYDRRFPYEIEPGAEYHEFGNLVVQAGDVLSMKTTFFFGSIDEDAITEYRLAYVE
jgi:hypothetical protein